MIPEEVKQKTDNELIAEFMGEEVFLYNVFWDQLMRVVENIESLGYYNSIIKNTRDGRHYCEFLDKECKTQAYASPGKTKIESVYKSVVEFIKYYNTLKP